MLPNVIPTHFSMIAIESLLQPKNAEEPIDFTLLGIVTDVNDLQYWNALIPIDVTLLGMFTDVREAQKANA